MIAGLIYFGGNNLHFLSYHSHKHIAVLYSNTYKVINIERKATNSFQPKPRLTPHINQLKKKLNQLENLLHFHTNLIRRL